MITLLDVVDAAVDRTFAWIPITIFALTVLVEALVMLMMKYNRAKKTLLDSFLANLVSAGIGFGLVEYEHDLFNNYRNIGNLVILLGITTIAELGILYLLNRNKPFPRTLMACLAMNIVSYALFYLFIRANA